MKSTVVYGLFWLIHMLFFFWIFARLFFFGVAILIGRINDEKFIWNEERNPEKLKICGGLFLAATLFIIVSYRSIFYDKFSSDLWFNFPVGILGLAGISLLIEKIIRTPSKSYLNNSTVEIKDDKKQLISSTSNNLLEVVSAADKSLLDTENDVSYNNQNDVLVDDKVVNQEKPQLQSDDDIEAHDVIDVKQGVEEISQPLDKQVTGRDLNRNQKQEGIQETISLGKKIRQAPSRVLLKSSDVVHDGITDEIIQDKIAWLKESYGLYCDTDDFASALKKKEVNKKILFVNKDNKTVDFKRKEYLKLLNFLIDGNIGKHPQNKLVAQWIHDSFDRSNIKNLNITTIDISKFKSDLKK